MNRFRVSILSAFCLLVSLLAVPTHTISNDWNKMYPNGIKKPTSYCRRQLDLTILVDESGSILRKEWDKLIPFLKSLVRSVNIGPNYVHLSLVTYSTSIRWLISYLDPASKREALALQKIDLLRNSKPAHGLTFTGQALNFIREAVYPLGARKNAPKAIIIITDGASTQPKVTSQAAAMLRDKGVTMLVVGVGSARDCECRAVVGCPVKGDCPSFFKTKWEDIIQKVGGLITEVCETIPQDAECKPHWSEWSKCNVECGKGMKFKKILGITTLKDETIGTNGKSGKTCKEQLEELKEQEEECFVPCIEKEKETENEQKGEEDSNDILDNMTNENDEENLEEEPEEEPETEPEAENINEEFYRNNYVKHESTREEENYEKTSNKSEFKREGAKIAGGIILALVMLGAGGGYAFYKKKTSTFKGESDSEQDFSEAGLIHSSQEGESYTVTDLDDGLWSESH